MKLRVKDRHADVLRAMAIAVNTVWNYVNETSAKAAQHYASKPRWLSSYDLQKLTAGASAELGLHSHTAQQVCEEYVTRRKQFKRRRLNWRVSNPRRSLGWVPFKIGSAVYRNGQVRFNGTFFGLWDSYGLGDYELRAGSFSEDARGRWYLNIAVKVQDTPAAGALGIAQRAGKKGRVRSLHAKIGNRRKDALHKLSSEIVARNALIVVGDVSSSKLVKTKMAKSVLDAGWSQFKTMLEYKAVARRATFVEVNEAFSSQTCSACWQISAASPKGRAGLGIREWTCSDCAAEHHCDVNAAVNILAAGHRRLAQGIHPL